MEHSRWDLLHGPRRVHENPSGSRTHLASIDQRLLEFFFFGCGFAKSSHQIKSFQIHSFRIVAS